MLKRSAILAIFLALVTLLAPEVRAQETECPLPSTYPSSAENIATITALSVALPLLAFFLWKWESLSRFLAFQKRKLYDDTVDGAELEGTRAITVPENVNILKHEDFKPTHKSFSCAQSGEVWRCLDSSSQPVLIKHLSGNSSVQLAIQATLFEREIRMLSTTDNPGILKLLGVVNPRAISKPPGQVLECPKYGMMWRFLREASIGQEVVKPQNTPDGPVPAVINRATMIRFACDLCSAVAYLAEKGLVHKDIAARHCFVTEDFQVKLSLFELHVSSQSWEYDKPHGFRSYFCAPRWQPPEIKDGLMTPDHSTDVWSLGVTIWEIFSKGEKPYSALSLAETMAAIRDGTGLEIPPHADEHIYTLMKQCWVRDKTMRVTAANLLVSFQELIPDDNAGLPGGAVYEFGRKRSTKTASLRGHSHSAAPKKTFTRRASLPADSLIGSPPDNPASAVSDSFRRVIPSISDADELEELPETTVPPGMASAVKEAHATPSSDTGEEGKKEKSDTGFANTPSRVSTAPLLPQQYSPTNLEYQEAEL